MNSEVHSGADVKPDTSELYYAHMEADRNEEEEAFFAARPKFDYPIQRATFRAGFERAYQKLWPAVIRGGGKP